MSDSTPQIFSDIGLARRLERAEGHAGSRYVEARARVSPASGAEWIEVAGVYAMYDGARSPITQTFGLGIFQPATEPDLNRLEAFFRDRGAPVLHEVSPLADKSLWPLLNALGYKPVEFSSVLYLPIGSGCQSLHLETKRFACGWSRKRITRFGHRPRSRVGEGSSNSTI